MIHALDSRNTYNQSRTNSYECKPVAMSPSVTGAVRCLRPVAYRIPCDAMNKIKPHPSY